MTQKTKILQGFNPVQNEQDRRILYEFTGMRLYKDEFRDEASSDDEDGDEDEQGSQLLPIDYAFMYKSSVAETEEDDESNSIHLGQALNP